MTSVRSVTPVIEVTTVVIEVLAVLIIKVLTVVSTVRSPVLGRRPDAPANRYSSSIWPAAAASKKVQHRCKPHGLAWRAGSSGHGD
jgi:hypothetical protein